MPRAYGWSFRGEVLVLIEFYRFGRPLILAIMMLSSLGVIAQTLAVIASFSRHRASASYWLENLTEIAMLIHSLLLAFMISRISADITALLLSLILIFAFCACGGPASNGTQTSDAPNVGNETDAAGANPYNLDYEMADVQEMSSDRMTKAELLATYDHFVGMDASERKNITYKDIVEHLGCDASEFYGLTSRSYVWYASDDQYAQMNATFLNDGGDWSNPIMSSGNLK